MIGKQVEIEEGFIGLFETLQAAYEQAAHGKGKERHGAEGMRFEDQPIFWIAEEFGDGFLRGQAAKKILESKRLEETDPLKAIEELKGAIVYIAAQIMLLEERA